MLLGRRLVFRVRGILPRRQWPVVVLVGCRVVRWKDEESTLSVSQSFLMQSTSSTVTELLDQSLVCGSGKCEMGRAYIECRDLEPVSLCRSIAAVQSTHN